MLSSFDEQLSSLSMLCLKKDSGGSRCTRFTHFERRLLKNILMQLFCVIFVIGNGMT